MRPPVSPRSVFIAIRVPNALAVRVRMLQRAARVIGTQRVCWHHFLALGVPEIERRLIRECERRGLDWTSVVQTAYSSIRRGTSRVKPKSPIVPGRSSPMGYFPRKNQ